MTTPNPQPSNQEPDGCAWEFQLFDRLGLTIISDDEFSRLLAEQDARSETTNE